MTCIVVLGMHSGGTSLAAGMLHAAGVDMHPNPTGHIRRKGHETYWTYEDSAFVRLNAAILHHWDGGWKKPPPVGSLPDDLRERAEGLIQARQHERKLWGFKDPRTALTIPAYHELLDDPRYVVVRREREAIAQSLTRRGIGMGEWERWPDLIDTYYERIDAFIEKVSHVLNVHFELLLSTDKEAHRLLEFAGVDDLTAATEIIQHSVGIIRTGD